MERRTDQHEDPPRRPDELLATCWTSAGDAASDRSDLRSPLTLRERIEAASAAGIRTMLADNAMVHLEPEGIPFWWEDGARREVSDRVRHSILEAAEALGARPQGDARR